MNLKDMIGSSFSPRSTSSSPRQPENEGLQIFCNKELVGYLQAPEEAYRGKFIRIPLEPEPPSFDSQGNMSSGVEQEYLEIQPTRRSFAVDEYRIMQSAIPVEEYMAYVRRDNKIPSYASMRLDGMNSSYILSWHVGLVSVDQHEALFDLDAFVPC